jgi:putative ABC transport system permease protein
MARAGEIWRRLVFLFRRGRMERDLAEEMRDHMARKAESNVNRGMTAEDARAAAQRQLGNLTLHSERSRANWGFPLLESLFHDTRYGLRGLRKAPGYSVVAILTLALGIGATTAIFSITNAVVLRPLPYKDANRLVFVWTVSPQFPEFHMGQAKPNFDDIRAHNRSFENMALYQPRSLALTGNGDPEQISAAAVSPDFLPVLAVQPLLGRGFQPGDDEVKTGNVVLLSYSLWQQRFAGDKNIVGKELTLSDQRYSVIGVLPQGFSFPSRIQAWVPLVITGRYRVWRRSFMYYCLARLKDGVSLRSAQAEMDQFAGDFSKAEPKELADMHFLVMPMHDWSVGQEPKTELWILAGAVSFLLLIGCANVSNLILSRGIERRREIALRAALGASRSRLLRQLLVESLLLAFAGGASGLLVAAAGIGAFRAFAPSNFTRLDEIRLEPAVALIAFAVSTVAGLLCGLAPALHAARADLNAALKDQTSSSTAAPRRLWLRTFLVTSEIALALVLLTGSALMVQSFARLMKVDTGFRTDHLLTADIHLASSRYPTDEAQTLFLERLLDSLRAEPEFSAAAVSNHGVLDGEASLMSLDKGDFGSTEDHLTVEVYSVAPGYVEAMGIPLLAGRSFNDRDVKGSPQVVVINQAIARRFFSGQDPVGKIASLGDKPESKYRIVGVVADIRDIHLDQTARLEMYFPLLQSASRSLHVMVRSSRDPLTLTSALQQRVWSVDKDEPLYKVSSMDATIAESVAEPRFRMWLLSAFAAAGLALTLIGVYGVISYSVSQRTQEMAIRVALGAQAEDVRRLILTQGLRLSLIGAAAGALGSLGLTRLLASKLYQVKPGDPVTLIGAAVVMLAVALFASYIPARRATRVDPMTALRNE